MLVLAGILVSLASFGLVLSPLLGRFGAPLTDGPDLVAQLRELYAFKDVTYETLRDLEFDYHAGKIGERDFQELSDRYKREAVTVVRRIDELEAKIPGLPTRRRGSR